MKSLFHTSVNIQIYSNDSSFRRRTLGSKGSRDLCGFSTEYSYQNTSAATIIHYLRFVSLYTEYHQYSEKYLVCNVISTGQLLPPFTTTNVPSRFFSWLNFQYQFFFLILYISWLFMSIVFLQICHIVYTLTAFEDGTDESK